MARKTVAVAAGLGVMGLHRNVIHLRFGNYVLLAKVLVDASVTAYGQKLDHSPCLDCKLCVAACPVGADRQGRLVRRPGLHDPRLPGVPADFRSRVSHPENASMGQSLAFRPRYKSGYRLAVCPAGEDVLGPYLDGRRAYLDTVLLPLLDKTGTLYVLPGSKAQRYAERRFPHKPAKEVSGGWRAPARSSSDSSGGH
ncbi:hypothetical protein [Streptomyces sp. NPDC054783]